MSERRYKPTRKRLQQARRDGKSSKSQLLTTAGVCLSLFVTVVFTCRYYWVENQILLEYLWLNNPDNPLAALAAALQCVWKVLVPCIVIAGVVAVGAQVLQVGLVWELAALAPKFDRISPAQGLNRIAAALRQLGWATVRVVAMALPALWLIFGEVRQRAAEPFTFIGFSSSFTAIESLLAILVVLGVIDWRQSARRYRDSVYMTLDEMRREHRENEGDPHIKAYRRAQHAALSRDELVRRVRRAKVIVVERAAETADV